MKSRAAEASPPINPAPGLLNGHQDVEEEHQHHEDNAVLERLRHFEEFAPGGDAEEVAHDG
jgi:hypothetical protein